MRGETHLISFIQWVAALLLGISCCFIVKFQSGERSERFIRPQLLALSLMVLFALIFFASPASAQVIDVGQGDIIYWEDTADLSLVVAWPDYKLAWCADGEPGCSNPFVIDLGNENQHRVYISRDRFKPGSYYRWDGQWNRGENAYAMKVIGSTRPVNETVQENATPILPIAENLYITPPARTLPNNTHIIIARGDALEFNYAIPNQTRGNPSWIWMFSAGRDMTNAGIMGSAMRYRSNDSVYSWDVTPGISDALMEGNYTGYLQYSGDNKRQDVFYRESHKVNGEPRDVLDTLYDDDLIPDVPIEGLMPLLVKDRFENLAVLEYIDDTLIPVSMEVRAPSLYLTEYYTIENNLTISGVTTCSPGTMIIIKLDEDQYKLPYDVKAHTWSTQAIGTADRLRTFNASIPLNWDEMAIGTHTIKAYIDKPGIYTETFKDFKVSDLYVFPTPTPAREKVVLEEYGWHRITPAPSATPTQAPAPAPAAVVTLPPVPPTPNVTISNVTVLPVNTTAIPTTKRTPRPTESVNIPISPAVGILAVAVVALWRKK